MGLGEVTVGKLEIFGSDHVFHPSGPTTTGID